MRSTGDSFLGTGWRFPLQVTPRGGLALAREEERVAESIALILGTARGERVMRPEFGCDLHELVFEPNDDQTQGRAVQSVRRALVEWEPRIDVLEVRVDSPPEEPNLLLIRVDYRLRATNSFSNLVYPFYFQEGG